MAFPTGPVDGGTLYTDEYGNVFIYNINTSAWEKYLGDGIGEPVLTSGATMFGDLVQTPSTSVRPQLPQELSLNRVDDTKLQFRYQGDDFATRGFDMDLDCVEEVTQPLIITSESLSEDAVFVQFGDTLEAHYDGAIAGGDPSTRTFMWERSDSIADGSVYSDTGITSETYTVLESDRGKWLRRRDTWTGTGTCGGTFVQRSNPLAVVFQLPTPTAYFAFSKEGGPGSLELELSAQTTAYKVDDNGAWEPIEIWAAGSRTLSFNNAATEVFVIESTDMTHFKWVAGDENFNISIDARSLTPALTSLYQSFSNLPNFNANLNWLQTPNVTNMARMFEDSPKFNAMIDFDWSKVQNAHKAFHNCSSFEYRFVFDVPELEDASFMFSNCDNMEYNRVDPGDKLTNCAGMFSNCKKWNGLISLQNAPNLSNTANMFLNCHEYAPQGSNLKTWQLSNVTNAYGMFRSCRKFNPAIGGADSNFKKMQKLQKADYMFYGCSVFNQYYMNKMQLTNCRSMRWMFGNCPKLVINVENHGTQAVESMGGMFYLTKRVDGLGTWSPYVQYVEDMSSMFGGYQHGTLEGVSYWNTLGLKENGLNYFLDDSNAFCNIHGWRVKEITTRPRDFADNRNLAEDNPGGRYHPEWGTYPVSFAWSPGNGRGKTVNKTNSNLPSGQGRIGDVLEPLYNMEGGTVTYQWNWRNPNTNKDEMHPNNPGTRYYTTTSIDRGARIWCKLYGTSSVDGSQSYTDTLHYIMAGSNRSQSATAYSVTTTDSPEGSPVQVNLQFTGTDPIPYYKMGFDGEFEVVGEMMPGSPKVLTLPEGVWTWEAINMTVLNYDDSPFGVEIEEHDGAYKDAVL